MYRSRKFKRLKPQKNKPQPKRKPGTPKFHAPVPFRQYDYVFNPLKSDADPEGIQEYMQDNYQENVDAVMDRVHPIQDQFSYGPYNELVRVLPAAKKLLGTNDIQVMMNNVPTDYMDDEKFKDRAIKVVGSHGGPFIYDYRMHIANSWGPGVGLTLYQTREKTGEVDAAGKPLYVRYVLFQMRQPGGGHERMWVIPKGQVFRFMRYAHLQNKLCVKDMSPPILEDGMLQKIVNQSINFLINKDEVEKYGIKVRRGIILAGSPGNGKTMVCRWLRKLCSDNDIDMSIVSGSQIESAFNDGSLQQLFSKEQVLFFDDIDIGYLSRKIKANICNAILSAMDGVEQDDHVVRIFTTNEDIEDMDEAFIRPGRIDCRFVINKPTDDMKRQLVKRWHPEIVAYLEDAGGFYLNKLMEHAKEYSFADLDAIKSFLVTEKLMGGGVFDLEKAIADFNQGREATPDKNKPMGFGNNQK